jgi:hypothetical protein
MSFYIGVVAGIFLKDKLIHTFLKFLPNAKPKKEPTLEQKIEVVRLVLKVTNKEYFQELYPNGGNELKLSFNKDLVEYINTLPNLNLSVQELCDLNTQEHKFKNLAKSGNLYIYIRYNIGTKTYINVYGSNDTILKKDFLLNENNDFYQKYKNVMCVKIGESYVTPEFKKYLNKPNNTIQLTPEIMFNQKSKVTLLNNGQFKTFTEVI